MTKRVYSGMRIKRAEPFYFEDCYICQETKKAEKKEKALGVKELTEIFRKANERN